MVIRAAFTCGASANPALGVFCLQNGFGAHASDLLAPISRHFAQPLDALTNGKAVAPGQGWLQCSFS
tara:strand:- start:734 stop:934 length:201 start_codon:yes stop_codon:yes gene_type:complete